MARDASSAYERAELQKRLAELRESHRNVSAALLKARPALLRMETEVAIEAGAAQEVRATFLAVAAADVVDMHLWEHHHDLLISSREVLETFQRKLAHARQQTVKAEARLLEMETEIESVQKMLATWGEVVALFPQRLA